jgi:SAM-dependent methyltransferase
MKSVQEHYNRHLGPIYAWMVGGIDSALERGSMELEAVGAAPVESGLAVDLGAGFGMHAIPLARRGFNVLAIDNCGVLLDAMRTEKSELPIEIVEEDLFSFPQKLSEKPDVVLCMNDTLTHLADKAAVVKLIQSVAGQLTSGGQFIMTFRDYSKPLEAEQRFIPVRSNPTRIFSCFLEYADSHLTVNDILYEWNGSDWELSISSYKKVRISPEWLADSLRENGFNVNCESGASGMVRVVADRA